VPDDLKMLIGGEWVDSASGATFEATSPSTGQLIARVPQGGREDA
jgi:acyl-CoA reductase-like NAD-dependent aldehyde dehydrogenase